MAAILNTVLNPSNFMWSMSWLLWCIITILYYTCMTCTEASGPSMPSLKQQMMAEAHGVWWSCLKTSETLLRGDRQSEHGPVLTPSAHLEAARYKTLCRVFTVGWLVAWVLLPFPQLFLGVNTLMEQGRETVRLPGSADDKESQSSSYQ